MADAIPQVFFDTSVLVPDCESLIAQMADMNIPGGAVYDALHVRAARQAAADRLWTMSKRDFVRIWPDHAGVIEGA